MPSETTQISSNALEWDDLNLEAFPEIMYETSMLGYLMAIQGAYVTKIVNDENLQENAKSLQNGIFIEIGERSILFIMGDEILNLILFLEQGDKEGDWNAEIILLGSDDNSFVSYQQSFSAIGWIFSRSSYRR